MFELVVHTCPTGLLTHKSDTADSLVIFNNFPNYFFSTVGSLRSSEGGGAGGNFLLYFGSLLQLAGECVVGGIALVASFISPWVHLIF